MPKIEYDKESKVLSIEMVKTRSVDSDINGGVVIDYDKHGRAVRINFYEFNFDAFSSSLKVIKEFAKKSDFAFSAK